MVRVYQAQWTAPVSSRVLVEAAFSGLNALPVKMRSVRVRADIVTALVPDDLDIVVQRLDSLASADLFDLIIATNVLVYYGVFEQSLALGNVASMLRPGGLFLSNQRLEVSVDPDGAARAHRHPDGLHRGAEWETLVGTSGRSGLLLSEAGSGCAAKSVMDWPRR